jgi:hypothetical protein
VADSGEDSREGAWIFVSHSHQDLAKVRVIRDALEARGHNPLLFFLRCLGDDAEVDNLIRREIEARTWFVLCDSENARSSRWVLSELEIIKNLAEKVYEVIDLDSGLEDQLARIDRLSKRATVFLSYARPDEAIADRLRQALLDRDYAVWNPRTDLAPGDNWTNEIRRAVQNAMTNGLFVLLLSPAALESSSVQMELDYALELEAQLPGRLVPVLVSPIESEMLPRVVRDRNWLMLTDDHFDQAVEVLIRVLMRIDT